MVLLIHVTDETQTRYHRASAHFHAIAKNHVAKTVRYNGVPFKKYSLEMCGATKATIRAD